MVRVTVELISAVNRNRSRILGTMLICNDGTGSNEKGNYKGTLHAEYTPQDGRHGVLKGFNRQRKSVWSLVGAFLKLWGHTTTSKAPETTFTPLETRLLIECCYWRARAAGVTLFEQLPPIVQGVLDDAQVTGVMTDAEGLAIIRELQMRMLFETPALPPPRKPVTMQDDFF